MGQQVQYLIILTKIKYTKFIYIIIHENVSLSECRGFSAKQCRADTEIQSDVWTWLMLCCLQASFPHYLNPSDRKLSSQNPFLEPSSKPAQVDMKGTFPLFCIVKIMLSTPHLMLALMKHAGYYWYVCHSDSKYYVLTSSSMLK